MQGLGSENLARILAKQNGIETILLEQVDQDSLAECSVLIVPQQDMPMKMVEWAKYIQSWAGNGGGVMFTHDAVGYRAHMAVFPKIGHGLDHPKTDVVKVAAAHPVTAGLAPGQTFNPGFRYDHVVLAKGPAGEVVLASKDGRPALLAGIHGKGKVILNGMLTGAPGKPGDSAGETRLGDMGSDAELRIFLNSLAWLAPAPPAAEPRPLNPLAALPAGANLAVNAGAEQVVARDAYLSYNDWKSSSYRFAEYAPPGWGAYRGLGALEWGATAEEAFKGSYAAYLKFLARQKNPDQPGEGVSIGLLVGQGNGYSSNGAMACRPGAEYRFAFYMKSTAPLAQVTIMGWDKYGRRQRIFPSYLEQDGQRAANPMTGFLPSKAWTLYGGAFATDPDTEKFHLLIALADSPLLRAGDSIVVDDVWIAESENR